MNNNFLVFSISNTTKQMMNLITTKLGNFEIKDLVSSYVPILLSIYMNDDKLKMNEISRIVNKDKSTITVLVNRLIERGYVKKERSNLDRRVVYISLTEKGTSINAFYDEVIDEVERSAFESFSEGEKEQFHKLLEKINSNLSS